MSRTYSDADRVNCNTVFSCAQCGNRLEIDSGKCKTVADSAFEIRQIVAIKSCETCYGKARRPVELIKELVGMGAEDPEKEICGLRDFVLRNKGKTFKVDGNKVTAEPEKCKHGNWYVAGKHPAGKGFCVDCGKYVLLSTLFENMRKRLQSQIDIVSRLLSITR